MMMKIIPSWAFLSLILILGISPKASAQNSELSPDEQLARLELEPDCQQVQQAALSYFQITGEQVSSLNKRAKVKALLPVLELSGGYTDAKTDEITSNYLEEMYPWLTKAAGGNAWDARAKLVWNLPQLVFNSEVLDVAALSGLMQSVLKETTRLYYMRRRLQVDLILSPPTDLATKLSKQMRLDELTSLLDAMTGGWFSKSCPL